MGSTVVSSGFLGAFSSLWLKPYSATLSTVSPNGIHLFRSRDKYIKVDHSAGCIHIATKYNHNLCYQAEHESAAIQDEVSTTHTTPLTRECKQPFQASSNDFALTLSSSQMYMTIWNPKRHFTQAIGTHPTQVYKFLARLFLTNLGHSVG